MYESFITLKKMVYQAVFAGASAFVTYCINFIQELPPEQSTMVFGLVLVILKGAENWLKHRND